MAATLAPVDTQAFARQHHQEWVELEQLATERHLGPEDAERLMTLYQRTGMHLAALRGQMMSPSMVEWLSGTLGKARRRALTPRRPTLVALARFFTHDFPGALYDMRRWWLVTTIASFALMAVMTFYYLQNPQIESSLLSPAEIDSLVHSDFENYYSEYAATDFALRVWTNNAWLSAQAIALGFLGFPVIYILLNNAINTALTGSIMIHHGRADVFFGLITPHGLLELTAVFVAAGVGLRIFWSWVQPGDLPRASAFAKAGRASISVVLGIAVVLAVTGVIEAFVTPSPLPTAVRVGIGVAAEIAFFVYVWTLGRAARGSGNVGDVEDAVRRGSLEITKA
ncbi:putative membrane protein SpoIIM required for sporulation [Propioniferax innocua]|uniref:Putative membrane protein SpoIIM required for sporulation n=1 Tax=Propioniferax innocua TaxID=1753 RepID=A0A542ZDG0_9ACTN|nr:putative membrane protein SpoIIM required for sporulation [Propioniferax innocua]